MAQAASLGREASAATLTTDAELLVFILAGTEGLAADLVAGAAATSSFAKDSTALRESKVAGCERAAAAAKWLKIFDWRLSKAHG